MINKASVCRFVKMFTFIFLGEHSVRSRKEYTENQQNIVTGTIIFHSILRSKKSKMCSNVTKQLWEKELLENSTQTCNKALKPPLSKISLQVYGQPVDGTAQQSLVDLNSVTCDHSKQIPNSILGLCFLSWKTDMIRMKYRWYSLFMDFIFANLHSC